MNKQMIKKKEKEKKNVANFNYFILYHIIIEYINSIIS